MDFMDGWCKRRFTGINSPSKSHRNWNRKWNWHERHGCVLPESSYQSFLQWYWGYIRYGCIQLICSSFSMYSRDCCPTWNEPDLAERRLKIKLLNGTAFDVFENYRCSAIGTGKYLLDHLMYTLEGNWRRGEFSVWNLWNILQVVSNDYSIKSKRTSPLMDENTYAHEGMDLLLLIHNKTIEKVYQYDKMSAKRAEKLDGELVGDKSISLVLFQLLTAQRPLHEKARGWKSTVKICEYVLRISTDFGERWYDFTDADRSRKVYRVRCITEK